MSKENIAGIYTISNKVNGKQYIGSSKSVYYRWLQNHLPTLRRGNHHNRHLQSAWNKYGENSFEFQIIEECREQELFEREGFWIEKTRSWEREFGYNLIRIVDGKQVYPQETLDLLSDKISQAKTLPNYWTTGTNGEILKLYQEGMSKNAIAIELGVTRSAVYSCLEYHKLHINEGKGSIVKLTPKIKKQIKKLRDQGMSWEQIVEQIGVSKTQIRRVMKVKDGQYGGKQNIRTSYRSLTEELKNKAVAMREQGKSWKEIGEELGVCRQIFYWNGIAQHQPNKVRKQITKELIDQAAALRKQGLTWKEIGKKLGCSARSFNRYLPNL